MVSNSLKISQEEVVKALDRLRRKKADDPEYQKLRKDLPKNWPLSSCGIKTRDCNLDRLSLSGFRQPDRGLAQLQAGYTAPEFSFSRHRLNVAVPFQSESG